jgi:hypothetical protein
MLQTQNFDVRLGLETRRSSPIENYYHSGPAQAGDRQRVRDFVTEYPDAHHRHGLNPSRGYNCHGMTFGARRTGINLPTEIEKILREDGYRPLNIVTDELFPGDIAIYRREGEITHSGLIMWIERGNTPWILSKWGPAYHEAVHRPLDCPYNDAHVSYYRLDQ